MEVDRKVKTNGKKSVNTCLMEKIQLFPLKKQPADGNVDRKLMENCLPMES